MAESFATNDFVSEAIEKHADLVRRICYLHLKNKADVEDVFQEVFLQFFPNLGVTRAEAATMLNRVMTMVPAE